MKLKEKAKKFPLAPGIYMFLGKNREVLYVGRAISLRKRILNYFSPRIDSRIGEMVSLAKDIKYQKTTNLLGAIILEANLIKKYWPKYNVKEKDDRSFVYLAFTEDDFPKPVIIRGKDKEKFSPKKIFGPYQSLSLLKNALKIIRRIIPFSTCKPNGKACFERQIGLCPGVCTGEINKQEYKKNIHKITMLLSGQEKRLLKKISRENPQQATALKHLQDVILVNQESLEENNSKQNQRIEGYDISHFAGKETVGSMVVWQNNDLDKSQYRIFNIKEAPANDDLRALEEVLSRRLNHPEWPLPVLFLIDGGRPQVLTISRLMLRKKINIPVVGISKLQNDELVFPAGTKTSTKDAIGAIKNNLIKLRDEAHRFALKSSRKKRAVSLPQ